MGGCKGAGGETGPGPETGTGGGLSGTWGSSSVVWDALSSSVVDSSCGSIVEKKQVGRVYTCLAKALRINKTKQTSSPVGTPNVRYFHALFAMSWLLCSRCTSRITSCITIHSYPLSRKGSTSSKTIFQTTGSAEFLASVTNVNSFLRFNRLPEVS